MRNKKTRGKKRVWRAVAFAKRAQRWLAVVKWLRSATIYCHVVDGLAPLFGILLAFILFIHLCDEGLVVGVSLLGVRFVFII